MKKKTWLTLTACLCVFFLSACWEDTEDNPEETEATAAPTVDVTGTWVGSCTVEGKTNGGTLTLQQTGSNVTGGDVDNLNYTGTINGNILTLVANVPASNGGNVGSVQLSGPVVGNTLQLTGSVTANSNQGVAFSVPANCTWTRQ